MNGKILAIPIMQGRWAFVLIGFLMNFCLGSVYSWSVYRKPLEKLFAVGASESGVPFLLFLIFFALLMPIAGAHIAKNGPKVMAIAGSLLVGLAWYSSSFADSIYWLYISYGFLGGCGVGMVYGATISVAGKWFPDKKGLAVGLCLAGFGLSAAVVAPIARSLISDYGVMYTFAVLGIAFFVVLILCALLLRFPDGDWLPVDYSDKHPIQVIENDMDVKDMLQSKTFYILWICYIIGTLSGLMAIGISSPVAQEIILLDQAQAAGLVSLFALFNGVARPVFGWLTDKLSPKITAIITFFMLAIASLAMLQAGSGDIGLFIASFSCFWLCLGAWLSIAPTATAIYFGTKYHSKNYGIIYSAYGLGAIIGTILSGKIRDITGSYSYAFIPVFGLAIVGLVLAMFLLKKK